MSLIMYFQRVDGTTDACSDANTPSENKASDMMPEKKKIKKAAADDEDDVMKGFLEAMGMAEEEAADSEVDSAVGASDKAQGSNKPIFQVPQP